MMEVAERTDAATPLQCGEAVEMFSYVWFDFVFFLSL